MRVDPIDVVIQSGLQLVKLLLLSLYKLCMMIRMTAKKLNNSYVRDNIVIIVTAGRVNYQSGRIFWLYEVYRIPTKDKSAEGDL